MNTVKSPKKPLIFYYLIVMLALFLFNALLMPNISEMKIQEVDYGTFINMTEDKQIDQVEIQTNRILFTDKEGKVYKTGLMDDPNRTERLYASGAQFSSEIIEEMSPLLSFFVSWIVPMLIIILLGQLLTRKLMKSAGGSNSMMFNMGKSNAKVYVQSTNGIKFTDVAGEDEAKENLTEIVDYLHNPEKYKEIGAQMPKGLLLVGPPGTGKT
ncbi:MAG: ATP-dependent metallopeptidase FtsH/Yme1/Tma family protein, partial [Aristaeellaceae bacterium]